MTLMLDEDESFSMNAYVESPGEQRVALTGYIVQHRGDGTYIAPLLPQLFYGVTGAQLQTWRQDFTAIGDQTILSRSGGLPMLPREELNWRKVEENEQPKAVEAKPLAEAPNYWPTIAAILGISVAVYVGYRLLK
jgi:hypothetical protein